MTYNNNFTFFNFNTFCQPNWNWFTPMNFSFPSMPMLNSTFTFNTIPTFSSTPTFTPSFTPSFTQWSFPKWDTTPSFLGKTKTETTTSGSFASMSRSEALKAAQNNPNLEKLSGGIGWSISSASFTNDIPYAKKGTSDILARVSKQIGEDLVITSALGTKNSPHVKTSSSESHYNEENPKLDIGGGLSHTQAESLRSKLLNTGYFSRVEVEKHGDTAHLDVQIKDSAFKKLDTVA